tara:strand:- start:4964 stop:5602 length:639 start_codon:yes stop_codon:yes gene_type:complete
MKIHSYRSQCPVRQQQRGAVLVISLVFLLILTTLAVTNMREVALESRVTGNLVNQKGCFNASEAGLRDGEYRIAGKLTDDTPGSYPSIPIANYGGTGVLKPPNATSSCPTDLSADQTCVLDQDPVFTQAFNAGESGFAGAKEYSADDVTIFEQDILWYGVPFTDGAPQGQSENPEYGSQQGGVGPFRYEVNATSSDDSCRVDLRSTTLRIYL